MTMDNAMLRFSGVPIISAPLMPQNATTINLPRFSRHRSRRIWKKMCRYLKKTSHALWTDILIMDGKIFAHPSIIEAMKSTPTDTNAQEK